MCTCKRECILLKRGCILMGQVWVHVSKGGGIDIDYM